MSNTQVVQIEVPAGKKIMLQISIVTADVTPKAEVLVVADEDVPSLQHLAKIIERVCEVPTEQLRGEGRKHPLIFVRHLYVQVATLYNYNAVQIGNFLGGREHSTILNSLKVFRELYETLDDVLMLYIAQVQPYVGVDIKPYKRLYNTID
jgi:chromosomal replication initiation ATPase DnaA